MSTGPAALSLSVTIIPSGDVAGRPVHFYEPELPELMPDELDRPDGAAFDRSDREVVELLREIEAWEHQHQGA